MKKSEYQQYFHCFIVCILGPCILVQLLVEYSNYSNKHGIQRCGTYYKGGAYWREALISVWIPKGAQDEAYLRPAAYQRKCGNYFKNFITYWKELNWTI